MSEYAHGNVTFCTCQTIFDLKKTETIYLQTFSTKQPEGIKFAPYFIMSIKKSAGPHTRQGKVDQRNHRI